ncbi:DUF1800 domain-containing protein [Ferruginibacter paludis]|uniref:DUF1800 domain-containing protein n=1 Tax=Ferruginibacter paludis TaxID=1310417 RepID=UPI0025B3C83A|nr:DUF1800 domain-containing protein [Ferruginibacter paludis]MDN3658844.1 DUF1800 domain-containing protein [Ferruginibacter paludis]
MKVSYSMERKDFFKILLSKQDTKPGASPTTALTSTLKRYKGKWDEQAVVYFLKHTMFGAKPADVAFFKKKNLKNTVAVMLKDAAMPTTSPINNYASDKIEDEQVQLGSTWVNATNVNGKINYRRRNSYKQWWMGLMINQDRSITEKMVLFWHNHFATETNIAENPVYCYRYNLLLRQHALGNFKALAKAMTTDLCMLRYLNGYANTKKAPDENYGRELQELFTVGKGPGSHYTEADVKAAARVLTGYKIDNKIFTYSFEPNRHDESDKQFSAFYGNTIIKGRAGEDGAYELDDLIEMIFATDETARFICRKLYRFFVFYTIDDATEQEIIIPLSKILRKKNFEIKPVLQALLNSQHFFDMAFRGTTIKSPADFCVGLMREFNVALLPPGDMFAEYSMWEFVHNQASAMQQNIGDPPNVAGWPAYYQQPQYCKLWINSDTLPRRNQLTDRLLSYGFTAKNGSKINIDPIAYAMALPHPEDPDALISDSIQMLYTVPIADAEKSHIKSNILLSNLQGEAANHYWTNAWHTLIEKPDDAVNKKEVLNKLKNLYKYLLNRPEYQVY